MIGYCVSANPQLASYRLRVAIPSKHLGMPHQFGVGDVSFFYKNGNTLLANRLQCPIVYDVVNAHFKDPDYQRMADLATVLTCSSDAMAEIIRRELGREACVIPDPYENDEGKPRVDGPVLWFGHQANIESLRPYADLDCEIYTGTAWTLEGEASALSSAGVVLLTGNNPGASANRPIKALRAGRFVVAPEGCPESWKELSAFMWIGDVRKGLAWAFANREEACRKVTLGQRYVKTHFSPQSIGSQWADLFASILAQGTSTKTAGSALTSP
jgi:hypothetical protein